MLFYLFFIIYWTVAVYLIYRLARYVFRISDRPTPSDRAMDEVLRRVGLPETYSEQDIEDYKNRQAEIAQSFDL